MSERAATGEAGLRTTSSSTPSGRLAYDDQTSYALAILHDLVPADTAAGGKRLLQGDHRSRRRPHRHRLHRHAGAPAGAVEDRRAELAAAVFLQEEVPGWLYQVKNGATTIWERWDAIQADGSIFEPAMNSYNHYAYGAVCQWLFEAVAGFRPDRGRAGLPAHRLRADDHSRTVAGRSASRLRGRPHRGRLDGRWRQGDLRHRRAQPARAARWCSTRPTRMPSSTAHRSPRPAADRSRAARSRRDATR